MDSFVRVITFFSRGAIIDNYFFRIHYNVTFTILVVFALIVGREIYLGDPIKCSTSTDVAGDLNSICWMQSTFTNLDDWDKEVGKAVPFPGIGKYYPHETHIYHHNYNRMLLALCLQALFFYLPRYFWKSLEGGRIYHLSLALRSPFLPEDEKESKKRVIAKYLASNMGNHQLYFAFHAMAELMNFVNVVAQVIFMNVFLGGDFSGKVLWYGKDIWFLPGRSDALLRVFPRYTKCFFYTFGRSGDVQRNSALCTLPINPINEKIYVFLWFWCIFLAILSFLALVFRALTLIPRFRSTITFLQVRMVNIRYLEAIVDRCGLGDWLVLDLLAKNLDPLSYKDVINDLAHRLEIK